MAIVAVRGRRAMAAGGLCLAAACTPAVSNPVPLASLREARQQDDAAGYRIGPGDDLEFRFFYSPELNEQVIVRPDGKVTLPLVQDIAAAGLTPAELADRARQALSAFVNHAEATVTVRSSAAQRIFVGGEVGRPGMQPLTGSLTALQAIMAAEGFKDTARTGEVVVVRNGRDGRRLVFTLDLKSVLNGNDIDQDVALQPLDLVFVPRSDIADFNTWVDLFIKRNLPGNGIGFSYGISTTTNPTKTNP